MKRLIASVSLSIALSALGLIVLSPAAAVAQKSGAVERGRKLFTRHCATCHGLDAKGQGPVAAALKTGPPDLTTLQAPGEKFPSYRVATVIDGEKDVAAHGTRKMPVWGTIFRRTQGDLMKEASIFALVKYIESIQLANKSSSK